MALVEIGAVSGTRGGSLSGDPVAAAFNVAEGLNPASMLIPVTRVEGVTTTLAAPEGHLISGQAVVVDLDGGATEQVLVKAAVGLLARVKGGGKNLTGGAPARPAQPP